MGGTSDLPIRSRGVIAFVVAGAGEAARVLLLKRKTPPVAAWCPVSGRIEAGEKAWQTALREIGEETGLKDGRLYTTGVTDSFYDPQANTIELMPVFLFMIAREEKVTLDPAQSASAWLDVAAALSQLTFAGHKTALEVIRRDFLGRAPDPLQRITP
ncbi:NUDIX pyrophosphatase [Dongia sp.]|uniref:NUDIX hydrolase n=1 Tax=Dongia sp. TaxID=1977262 RepID=UPI003753E742